MPERYGATAYGVTALSRGEARRRRATAPGVGPRRDKKGGAPRQRRRRRDEMNTLISALFIVCVAAAAFAHASTGSAWPGQDTRSTFTVGTPTAQRGQATSGVLQARA